MTNIESYIETMFAIMDKNDGVGLSANQVGLNKSFFVYKWKDKNRVIINPQIIERSNSANTDNEGCLSLPREFYPIIRANEILVRCLDVNGSERTIEAKGMHARIIQHEIDHLDGKLIYDYF